MIHPMMSTESLYPGKLIIRHTEKEEGIVGITGGMLLGLEESIKVPERRLDVLVGRHLFESIRYHIWPCE
jgi:hypothetical protein